MSVLIPTVIIALLILLNALCVAAEFAIVAARRSRLEGLAGADNSVVKRIVHTLSDTSRQDYYIAVAQVGITTVTIALGMYAEPTLADGLTGLLERTFGSNFAASHTVAVVLAVIIIVYFHVVVGEMIPKALALQFPERTALGISRFMIVLGWLFYPLTVPLYAISNGLLRLLRIPLNNAHGKLHSSVELLHLVRESHESGMMDNEKQELINNIFDFGECRVHQVMTPRPRVKALEVSSSHDEIMQLMRDAKHSRFPVFEDDIDNIVGILHVKDVIRQDDAFELRALLRRVPHVPDSMLAEEVLAELRRFQVHMAVVLDEYGGTAGIVTLEDLLEEVVGEVYDELDREEVDIQTLEDGSLLVSGEVLLEDFAERYSINLTSDEVDTVAGVVIEALRRPPNEGDSVQLHGVTLTVEEVEGLAIRRVHVTLPEKPKAASLR